MKVLLISVLASAAAVLAILVFSSAPHLAAGKVPAAGDQPAAPVVVELFTSEGCSSCPPADRLLAELDEKQPVPGAKVIALEQHVDYWNDDGWADPFSSAQFSRRQQDYVGAFRINTPYTPQMVVDGASEFVGSDVRAAVTAITKSSRAPKVSIAIEAGPAPSGAASIPLRVRLEPQAGASAAANSDVVLAVTEDDLSSNVTNGENSGSKLLHRAVVRDMRILGRVAADGSFAAQADEKLSNNWKRENLRAVAFVQEGGNRRILGAAEISLAASAR